MDFTVHRYGTDAYGRPVLMTAFLRDWWEGVVDQLGFRPQILQGAFMSRLGGGAAASSGAHDLGGCLDVQTEGFTTAQVDRLVWTCRTNGAAAWRRDETPRHGSMPPHCHVTLGADRPLSDMAQISWNSYVSGGDGIAGPYPDYERRPVPLILTPPKDWFAMATKADLKAAIREVLAEDGLVDAPADDAKFSGGSTSVVGAIKRIWNLTPKGA